VSSKRSRISLSEAGQVQVDAIERDFQSYWEDIERAYGRVLPEEVRKSVILAVQALINDTAIEQNAFLTTVANERIREIRRGALELKSILNKRPLPDHHNEREITLLLNNEIKKLGPPRSELRESAMMASRLVTACNRALEKTASDQGFQEGNTWKHFIRVMTAILKKANLPTGASQSRDKRIDDRPSPFVALISEIQNKLPANVRRHERADPLSLAKKINEARRNSRDKSSNIPLPQMSQWEIFDTPYSESDIRDILPSQNEA
jgi:hypothetical protein